MIVEAILSFVFFVAGYTLLRDQIKITFMSDSSTAVPPCLPTAASRPEMVFIDQVSDNFL